MIARVPPSSDFLSWQQVFGDLQYKPVVEAAYGRDVKHILDLGANAGYASCYFAQHFPTAHIVAIEPDHENFKILDYNTKGLDVWPTHAAVWSENCWLKLDRTYGDTKDWATRTVPAEDAEDVYSVTMEELYQGSNVDILKIDIEGAEFEIFKNPSFLSHTGIVAIEIHPDLGDPNMIYDAFRTNGFVFSRHGEIIVAVHE